MRENSGLGSVNETHKRESVAETVTNGKKSDPI